MGGTGFDRNQLVADAIAATGFEDFGEPTWQDGLDRLLDSLRAEARLSELGETIVETEVGSYLRNRLGIVAHRTAHPELGDRPITRPLVIVGQPRTGTTILYDLLAQDPANRAPLTWEVDLPCPPPRTATYDTDPRIHESEASAEMADLVVPGFRAFHPIGARLGQECVRITGSEFRSLIFTVQYEVPTYNRWLLDEADLTPAYRWHRTFLEHLQSGHMADRWLLKSPAHLWHLDALLAEYPDAVVIQTHRDPLKVIASVSALTAQLRQMGSDSPSLPAAAAQYEHDIFDGLDRGLAARRSGLLPADQVVDVQFTAFMADPFATIAALYDQLGLPLSADAEARMRAFLARNPGDGGGGGTRYRWADTGLDADALRERAREYQEHFDVPSEPVA
jgi:hypothetical protein